MYLFWLWLTLLPNMSDKDKLYMLRLAGNPEDLYHGDRNVLASLSPAKNHWLPLLDKSLDRAHAVMEQCKALGIRLLPISHSEYPAILRNIVDPPLLLYCKGQLPDLSQVPMVGVVGTRKCSDYALSVAHDLGYGLGLHGAAVVSGMAAGVDGAVTSGALRANAPTVGVLGCGLDVIFPKSNAALYAQMEEKGCLISEYPPGTPASKWTFPRRNRIISGLSIAVAVVEAPEQSGALITARLASEQGRDVFAVPGRMGDPNCAGSNLLLRDGAGTVTCPWDILEDYAVQYPRLRQTVVPTTAPSRDAMILKSPPQQVPEQTGASKQKPVLSPQNLSATEQQVYSALGPEEQQLDAVAFRTGLSVSTVLSAFTTLEIKGFITTRPGGWARTI